MCMCTGAHAHVHLLDGRFSGQGVYFYLSSKCSDHIYFLFFGVQCVFGQECHSIRHMYLQRIYTSMRGEDLLLLTSPWESTQFLKSVCPLPGCTLPLDLPELAS